MKLKNLKYGFLISASTLFGGSSLSLYAQTNKGETHKIETVSSYKQQFLESIGADKAKLNIDFMVDSVANMVSHGDLVADVNVIELLAYLEPDSDEYQSYLANKHVVAHEMWHRICLMKGVLEQPMSATHFRTGQDNFEITASFLSVLTFRDDYIHATLKEREALVKSQDPKIQMYVQAIQHDIVRPLSQDKKDFDFEMQFIAVMVSNFWNNNMAESYANYHNALTLKSGRKEFTSPVYEKNFNHDIKIMNTIGGIDFSKYYNVKSVKNTSGLFPLGNKQDNVVLKRSLEKPDYETWINKKSKLKRYSKQRVEIPNFAGDVLAKEREAKPFEKRMQPYSIMPHTSGYKSFPKVIVFFKTAIELTKQDKIYKFYPNGSLDEITPTKTAGLSDVTTYNIDGSFEKGQMFQGRKNGIFTYYDANKKPIGSCSFKNGRPQNGIMIGVFNQKRFYYTYKDGQLLNVKCQTFSGKKLSSCAMNGEKPVSGLMPKDTRFHDMIFDVYDNGEKIATVALDDNAQMTDRVSQKEKTIKIERFYASGTPCYAAKITPFKQTEVLYDEKAKPVILRNKINQKVLVKGNGQKLEQIIQRCPLESGDKKIVFKSLVDLLKNGGQKGTKVQQDNILFDNPFICGDKGILIPDAALLSAKVEGKRFDKKAKVPTVKPSITKSTTSNVLPITINTDQPLNMSLEQILNKVTFAKEDKKISPYVARPEVAANSYSDGEKPVSPVWKPVASANLTAKKENVISPVSQSSIMDHFVLDDKQKASDAVVQNVSFYPVAKEPQAAENKPQYKNFVTKMLSFFVSTQSTMPTLTPQQDVASSSLSQNKKAPRFLWRKFAFSPKAFTGSLSEQSNGLTLSIPRIYSSIKSFSPAQNKKALKIKKTRFQNGFKLTSSKKILNMFKSRALSNQKFNASLLKTRYLSGKHRS